MNQTFLENGIKIMIECEQKNIFENINCNQTKYFINGTLINEENFSIQSITVEFEGTTFKDENNETETSLNKFSTSSSKYHLSSTSSSTNSLNLTPSLIKSKLFFWITYMFLSYFNFN